MTYRRAAAEDIGRLAEIRKKQLMDEGQKPDADIDAELAAFFEAGLADGTLVEWLAEEAGEIVATGAVLFFRFPPAYNNKSGVRGYITNMYTRDEYRGRGIATGLLERLAAEARERGVKKLWLGASKMGRPVYRKFGFRETDAYLEMEV